ncbi:MAG: hypothetical protein L0G20_08195 [Lactobacillus sp.]|nr:hypothetical protein [Lactobacillus sp.]
MTKPNSDLILYKEARHHVSNTRPIYIDTDLLDKLFDLKQETGIPVNRITEQFVHYGLKNVQIKDRKESGD